MRWNEEQMECCALTQSEVKLGLFIFLKAQNHRCALNQMKLKPSSSCNSPPQHSRLALKYIFHPSVESLLSLSVSSSQSLSSTSFLGVKANVRRIFSISLSSFSGVFLRQKDKFQDDLSDLCVLHFCPRTQTSFSVWIERVMRFIRLWFGYESAEKTNRGIQTYSMYNTSAADLILYYLFYWS